MYFDVNKPLPLGHQSTGWEMGETPAIICSLYDLFIKILNSPPILRPVPTKEMQLFCKYLQAFNQQPSYICAESKNDDGYEIADHFLAGWMNRAILVAHSSHRTLQHTIGSWKFIFILPWKAEIHSITGGTEKSLGKFVWTRDWKVLIILMYKM